MRGGHGEKFCRRQEAAITALLQSPTIAEAARRAKVHVQTLKRWLENPEFQRQYRAARREVLHGAQTLLLDAGTTAVRTLIRVMDNASAPASAQVAAARCVLEMILTTITNDDIERRLTALEAAAEQRRVRAWATGNGGSRH